MSELLQKTTGDTDPASTDAEKDKKPRKGLLRALAALVGIGAGAGLGADHAPAPTTPEISATSTPDAGVVESVSPSTEMSSDQPTVMEGSLTYTPPEDIQTHPINVAPETSVTSITPDAANSVPKANPENSTFTIPTDSTEPKLVTPQEKTGFNTSPIGEVVETPAPIASSSAEAGNTGGSTTTELPAAAGEPATPESTDAIR